MDRQIFLDVKEDVKDGLVEREDGGDDGGKILKYYPYEVKRNFFFLREDIYSVPVKNFNSQVPQFPVGASGKHTTCQCSSF